MKSIVASLGIDVSKNTIDGVILTIQDNPAHKKPPHMRVANSVSGVLSMLKWACKAVDCEPQTLRAVMENSGVYHRLTAQTLYKTGCQVVVTHPLRARHYSNAVGRLSKTDRVDARMLAEFGWRVRSAPWTPPPLPVVQLQALLARQQAIERDILRNRQRVILSQLANDPAALSASLARARAFFLVERRYILEAIEAHYVRHTSLERDRQLLMSVPGIGRLTADHLLCLMRGRNIRGARQAAALCGLVPIHRRSGSSISDKPRISSLCNRRIRHQLYLPALSRVGCDARFKTIYQQLIISGLHPKQALIAMARRLVQQAYGVLKNGQPYDPMWHTRPRASKVAAQRS